MEDREIVSLYWRRDEQAIAESEKKYGPYCQAIAQSILEQPEDARECVNDTWLGAWNAMPPHRPSLLRTFLGKLTRRGAIDRFRRGAAQKRGGGELPLCLDELSECVRGSEDVERRLEREEMEELMEKFLRELPTSHRQIFLRRYWYLEPVRDIGKALGFTETKVASILSRGRKKLRETLEKEGYLP